MPLIYLAVYTVHGENTQQKAEQKQDSLQNDAGIKKETPKFHTISRSCIFQMVEMQPTFHRVYWWGKTAMAEDLGLQIPDILPFLHHPYFHFTMSTRGSNVPQGISYFISTRPKSVWERQIDNAGSRRARQQAILFWWPEQAHRLWTPGVMDTTSLITV